MNTTVYLIRHSEPTPHVNLKVINLKDSEQIKNEKAFLSVTLYTLHGGVGQNQAASKRICIFLEKSSSASIPTLGPP